MKKKNTNNLEIDYVFKFDQIKYIKVTLKFKINLYIKAFFAVNNF